MPPVSIPEVPLTEFITERFPEFVRVDDEATASGGMPRPAIVDGITGDARSWKQLLADVDSVGALGMGRRPR